MEVGKTKSYPLLERLCTTCQKLEDEFHFVLECTEYNDLRNLYFLQFYRFRPNIYKIVELFSSNNKKCIRNLLVYAKRHEECFCQAKCLPKKLYDHHH